MECTKCGSSNCKTLEMIHASGTASGLVESIDGSANTKSQTTLAARCTPPVNIFSSIGTMLSCIIGFLALPPGCMSSAHNGTHFPANIGVGIAYMLVTAIILIIVVQVLSNVLGFSGRHERKLKEWESSFMCLDCGNVMIVADETSN